MSDTSENPARPVSLFVIVFLFVLFAAFGLIARKLYTPSTTLPQNAVAENASKDNEWRATSASRQEALKALQAEQAKKAGAYGWVDQKAGVVHLPIERAMELTAQQYGAKK
jgi:hypothetical protein